MALTQVQAADAVGDAGRTDAVDARVSIGSEPGAILTSRADVADGRTLNELVQAEDVVTGDAEYMADAELIQAIDHGRPDCRFCPHCSVCGSLDMDDC